MEADTIKPKLTRILAVDSAAKVAMIICLFSWFMLIFSLLHPYLPETLRRFSPGGSGAAKEYLKSALFISVLATLVIALRAFTISGIFKNGVPINGTIDVLKKRKSGGFIIYSYKYKDREYRKTTSLVFTETMSAQYHVGGPIDLMVSKRRPDQALVRDRFIS